MPAKHSTSAILSPILIDALVTQGKVTADTRVTVGRTGMGAAVRTGAPKPDISSVEAFKRTLLSMKSVGYPREGASGVHFLSVVDRLGIAEEMKSKLRPFDGGGPPVQAFAAGEPELVVGGTTLFPAMPGTALVGASLVSFRPTSFSRLRPARQQRNGGRPRR
jgi:molybdate transport system substrate-binding protein